MRLYRSKIFLILETLLIIVVPMIIAIAKPDWFRYRNAVMIVGLAYVFFVSKINNFSLTSLGLTIKNFKISLAKLMIPTTIILLGMVALYQFDPHLFTIKETLSTINSNSGVIMPIVIYSFISVPLQEILFRGFYISRLQLVSSSHPFLLWYSTFIFTLIHIPFGNIWMVLFSLIIGLLYASSYIRYKNIISIMLSHATFGILNLIFAFIRINS